MGNLNVKWWQVPALIAWAVGGKVVETSIDVSNSFGQWRCRHGMHSWIDRGPMRSGGKRYFCRYNPNEEKD